MRNCYKCFYNHQFKIHLVTGEFGYECKISGRPVNPKSPECPLNNIKCNNCGEDLESILNVKQETNLYALTLNNDEEFYETRDSYTVEYVCPKCFGVLNTEVVNLFEGAIREH